MSDRRFDGIELIEWADKYGHPEEWAKKAQDLHAKNERLAGELAQVKAERDEARALLAGWPDARVSKAEAERDTAIRHLEALAEPPMHLDTVEYPLAVDNARMFLASMREKADQP